VPTDEAIAALAATEFDGKWEFTFLFMQGAFYFSSSPPSPPFLLSYSLYPRTLLPHNLTLKYSVDLGPTGGGAAPQVSSTAYALNSGGFANKSAAKAPSKVDKSIRENSKVSVEMDLKPKGQAYFQGEISSEFAVFGNEGKVTGALQRGTGKVSTTIQMVARNGANAVTTSFNLTGVINKDGVYQGNFSATEISRNAGNCSGLFKAKAKEKTESEDEEEKAEAAAVSPKSKAKAAKDEDSDDDDSAVKTKAAAASKKKEEEEAAAAAAAAEEEAAKEKARKKEEKRLAKQRAAEEEAAAAAAAEEAEAEAQAAVSRLYCHWPFFVPFEYLIILMHPTQHQPLATTAYFTAPPSPPHRNTPFRLRRLHVRLRRKPPRQRQQLQGRQRRKPRRVAETHPV